MKLKTFKVLENDACKYPDTKDYFEESLKEVCEGLTVEEVIYFVVCFCPMSSCLLVSERVNGLLFHALAIVLEGGQVRYLNIYD